MAVLLTLFCLAYSDKYTPLSARQPFFPALLPAGQAFPAGFLVVNKQGQSGELMIDKTLAPRLINFLSISSSWPRFRCGGKKEEQDAETALTEAP
ncbi:MAG: hypothetical protein FWG62_09000 [Proteobacteria bacterium]|nr:hypothetical protein [Pseudomonadota bacterium]